LLLSRKLDSLSRLAVLLIPDTRLYYDPLHLIDGNLIFGAIVELFDFDQKKPGLCTQPAFIASAALG